MTVIKYAEKLREFEESVFDIHKLVDNFDKNTSLTEIQNKLSQLASDIQTWRWHIEDKGIKK